MINKDISAILAVDVNNGIGFNNKILFHNPIDMKHFQNITKKYYHCVVGRKTYKDLPALKQRCVYVLSRSDSNTFKTIQNLNSFIVIGGNEIYKLFKDDVSTWYITYFKQASSQVDTYLDTSVLQVIDSMPCKELIFEDDQLSIFKYYKN